MDTLKCAFVNKEFMKNLSGKEEPCSLEGGTVESFESDFLQKTHNLVFAGQPMRTITLPQNGHEAWPETCSC